jgi:predicted Zn-dependent protease with MMP-like domain
MSGQGQLPPDIAAIEEIARAAIAGLPEPFASHLEGVLLVVEDFADDEILASMQIEDPFELTGLYTGRPVGEEPQSGDTPATIHLFRRPILDEWAGGSDNLEHLVTHVVIHEIGHHFGLSDDAMHAIEGQA